MIIYKAPRVFRYSCVDQDINVIRGA